MKTIGITLLLAVMIGCQESAKPVEEQAQPTIIDSFITEYDKTIKLKTNDIEKNEYRNQIVDSLNKVIVDNYSWRLPKRKLFLQSLKSETLSGKTFTYGLFTDKTGNEYHADLVYDNVNEVDTTATYKLLKSLKEGQDTTISFMSMKPVQWRGYGNRERFKFEIKAL
ncbi:MAG: hypothetical protein EOO06_03915 [Chitinophagaceae bacterium]|nr:MAG: hypothetical protein EOO06_03915 [Chitinophagaceae bacterium]